MEMEVGCVSQLRHVSDSEITWITLKSEVYRHFI